MSVLPERPDWYLNQMREGQPFTFVRFGNGEWNCIFSKATRTGSGSQALTSPALRQGLEAAVRFSDKRYFRGIQSVDYLRHLGLWSLISEYEPEVKWHVGDMWHHASARGKLYPLVKWLRTQRVGLIGPAFLNSLLPWAWHVKVKPKDCFQDYYKIRSAILSQSVADVYAFSAGPTAKVLIRELYEVIGHRAFILDFGSLWDPYCGKVSRKYHKKITPDLVKLNLEGE